MFIEDAVTVAKILSIIAFVAATAFVVVIATKCVTFLAPILPGWLVAFIITVVVWFIGSAIYRLIM